MALVAPAGAAFAAPIIRAETAEYSPNTPVVIVGSYGVGETIRAIYPSDDATVSASFEWFADTNKLQGEQSSTLALTSAHIGRVISAKITLSKSGLASKEVVAPGAKVLGTKPTSGGSMTYQGESVSQPGCFAPRASQVETPTVGWPLFFSCQPFNTDFGNNVEQKFSWYRNGKQIEGANNISYRLQAEDAGQVVWGVYQVTYSNGYVFTEAKKLRQAIPYVQQLTKPTIVGTMKLGSLLLARTIGWPNANLSYQWFSDFAPVAGANSPTFTVRQVDLGKTVQVMVSSTREGYTAASALSLPAKGGTAAPINPFDAYSKIFSGYSPTTTNYDIKYISSPNVTDETLAREKLLVNRAADFWANHYTPAGVTVVYLTKTDATWAEDLVAKNPSWKNNISGGIRSWIEKGDCGFALAFKADNKQVFIQCVRNGSDSTINDQQVGPHEYSHWVQYEQTPFLFLGTIPWLVEGQANFYGLALGIAPEDKTLKHVNLSLAGHATQYDIYNGYKFGELRMLDIFQRANSFDTQIMLTRGGTVWEAYTIGTVVSEWLVSKYGHEKYVAWMKRILQNKGPNNASEKIANAAIFKEVFGFEYDQLGLHMTPYFAERSAQFRAAWAEKNKNQLSGPTMGTTQQLPAFEAKKSTINADQTEWLEIRLSDGPVRQVTCTTYLGAKTTAKDKAMFMARAKAACGYAKTKLTSMGRQPTISVSVKKTIRAADFGKVWLTFKG
jgi:hypothetical protein